MKQYAKHDARLVIMNAYDSTVLLRVEPWADEYDLAPGATATVDSFGPNQVDVLFEISPGVVTVWEQSTGNVMSEVLIEPGQPDPRQARILV